MSDPAPVNNYNDDLKELTEKVEKLDKKMDNINKKLSSIEKSSEIIVENSKKLEKEAEVGRVFDSMRGELYDPGGFLSMEMTNYLFNALEKYENTEFRTWLKTRGRKVVEQSIDGFIDSRLPQLSWYGAKITHKENDEYHYSANTSFPFEIQTGIPLIGKLIISKIIANVNADVNSTTKAISNMTVEFSSDVPNASVFEMIEDEIEYTLKPHKTTWAIVSPIGQAIKSTWSFFAQRTSFSIPFALLFFITLRYPQMPPGFQISRALNYPLYSARFFNLNLGVILIGIINGIIIGLIIYLVLRYYSKDDVFILKKDMDENEEASL